LWNVAPADAFNCVDDSYIKCSQLFAAIEEENEVQRKRKDQ